MTLSLKTRNEAISTLHGAARCLFEDTRLSYDELPSSLYTAYDDRLPLISLDDVVEVLWVLDAECIGSTLITTGSQLYDLLAWCCHDTFEETLDALYAEDAIVLLDAIERKRDLELCVSTRAGDVSYVVSLAN